MWREESDGNRSPRRPSWGRYRDVLVLAFCASLSACSSSEETPLTKPEHAQQALLAEWMVDVDEERRQECLDKLVATDTGFYGMLARESDDASIAANAAAAVQILQAVEGGGHWAEMPLAVYAAVATKGEGPSEPGRLFTNTCDLTRNTKAHVIDIQLPPEMGRRLEIRLENILTSGPILKFSLHFFFRIEITPLRELLDLASPADDEGVRRIVVDCNQDARLPILLPEPRAVPMVFSAVDALGRRSNAISIARVGGAREARDGAPRRPFGSMTLMGPFISYPHTTPAPSPTTP